MNLWNTNPGHRLVRAAIFGASLTAASLFAATNFTQHNTVADTSGVADNTDPNLVGTWGISASPTSPFWVSNTSNGTSTLYNTAGVPNALVAQVPPSAAGKSKTGTPTGQVWSGYGAGNFEIAAGRAATFIFATLDGTISGYNGTGTPNVGLMFDDGARGSSYTGLGIGVSAIGPTLYAANFGLRRIDTFDKNYKPVSLPGGGFQDVDLPGGYAPFNIQRFGQRLYVTYALSDGKGGWISGPGTGLVNVFDVNGNLLQRVVPNNSNLNVPWGLAVAGQNFGAFSYALLVGNFGDGTIVAFDPITGNYLGTMQDGKGNNLSIDGLWGLQFGSQGSTGNANGGDATALYFAAAPSNGQHGLFGFLRPAADSLVP
jgi:uncharacterized protein (TIGR03118 family)